MSINFISCYYKADHMKRKAMRYLDMQNCIHEEFFIKKSYDVQTKSSNLSQKSANKHPAAQMNDKVLNKPSGRASAKIKDTISSDIQTNPSNLSQKSANKHPAAQMNDKVLNKPSSRASAKIKDTISSDIQTNQ